jgi:nitroimidazol reductase NimA-like FMN-containing flavoprotein (pyridoxamine 5'-phosphate oxidase superfamily)
MRKIEEEITDLSEIEAILDKAEVCRLSMADGSLPYIVPLNFGYTDKALYFHTGHKGKKIDILRKNRFVCFEVEVDTEVVRSDIACDWRMRYRSVIGLGKVVFIEDPKEKAAALDIIMDHYAHKGGRQYREGSLEKACIIKVMIDEMKGRKSGY